MTAAYASSPNWSRGIPAAAEADSDAVGPDSILVAVERWLPPALWSASRHPWRTPAVNG